MPVPAAAVALMLPWFWAALRVFIIANITGFVIRLLAGLGLYFLVLDPATDYAMDLVENRFGLLPPVVADWIGYLNFDKYVSLILSAYSIQWGVNWVLRMRGS